MSALAALAERQYGVFSLAQAKAAGFSRVHLARAVRAGRWERLYPRVYRIRGAPPQWKQTLSAALLWAGPLAAASHRAAGALWELDGLEQGPVEVIVPFEQHRVLPGVAVHRSRTFTPRDVTHRAGLPATTLVRTLIDLASVLAPDRLEVAFESALRCRLDLGWLMRRIGQTGGRGTAGVGALERLVKSRRGGREPLDSALEVRLAHLLKQARLPAPVPHFDVVDGVQHVAELDFAYPKQRVGIQADGYRFHSSRSAWERDRDQASALAALHWRVVPVTWRDLEERPDEVVERIRRALAR